jgi:hypothetical protein
MTAWNASNSIHPACSSIPEFLLEIDLEADVPA